MREGRDAPPGQAAAGVVVVTGGSRGIGAATARLAAAQGYRVCVGYLRARDEAEAVVADIERRGGQAMTRRGRRGPGGRSST
jgi:NAD(P)-dependent dehydrogenase (short-subunit alcohol dehydrogenase family)